MTFLRLLVVTALVSALGGLFGASVGGLLGYAVPSSLSVFFGTEAHGQLKKDARASEELEHAQPVSPSDINRKVELGVDSQKNMLAQGAAVGGALGLVVGAFLGFLLGIVDQVLLLVRGLLHARKEHALQHPPAPRGPPV